MARAGRRPEGAGDGSLVLLGAIFAVSKPCCGVHTMLKSPTKSQGQYVRVLQIRVTEDPLLTVRRSKRWKKHMVYILVANKSFKYESGQRSHVIYIGTTGKGGRRPATSAIDKASEAFYELRGVKEIKSTSRHARVGRRCELGNIWSPLYWRCSGRYILSFRYTTSERLHCQHGRH